MTADRTQIALQEMAREDPELAARLVLQTLPAAARRILGPLTYDLAVEGVGTSRVTVTDSRADVSEIDGNSNGPVDFRLVTDPEGLARMAAGASPLRLMLGGRLKVRGSRLKAMR